MKSLWLERAVVLSLGFVFLAAGPQARADEAPPVQIRMPLEKQQAVSGKVYVGVFEVEVYEAGTLADFKLGGEGWTPLSLSATTGAKWMKAGVMRIPFRAIPADADKPLRVSLTYNGRRVTRIFEIGPAYFARAGKPYQLAPVPGHNVSVAGAANRSSKGGASPAGEYHFVGRIVYSRPGIDLSDPPDGDYVDFGEQPPATVGVDHIDVCILDNDPLDYEDMWCGETDENGYFDTQPFPWEGTITDPEPDLVLWCETEVEGIVDVTDNSDTEDTYTFQTPEIENFEGSYHDFGWYFPEPAGKHPALHIFNSVMRTRRFIEEKPGYITPEVQVEWPDDSKDGKGAWYERGPVEIHISTEQQWHNETVSHEYGHHFLVMTYDPDPPYPEYCNGFCDMAIPCTAGQDCPDNQGHCPWCQETDFVAFNEGFSNWLADVVTRDYPDRYTHDRDGPPFVPLYTFSQESTRVCCQDGQFHANRETEGFVGALLRDIEDQTQDDHDDDPEPPELGDDHVLFDGVLDLMCLGPNEIFHVTYNHEPVTVADFLTGFLADYPEYTDLLWPTAWNVAPSYVAGLFPTDTEPPGIVPHCNSPTHPLGTGGSLPCITFEWWPARDDVEGASRYNYEVTTDPNGIEPGEGSMTVTGTDTCTVSATVQVWELGEHYFSIKAGDNDGNWSSQWRTFGPFEILDCNNTGILDACDIDCDHQGIWDCVLETPSPCPGLPGCGLSEDCQPNLIPDECDIANGTSEDCDQNGVPDECDAADGKLINWARGDGFWNVPNNWFKLTECSFFPQSPPACDYPFVAPCPAVPDYANNVCINCASDDITVTYTSGYTDLDILACYESLNISGGSSPILHLLKPSWVDGSLGLSGNGSVLEVSDNLDIGGLFTWTGSGRLTGSGETYANGGVQTSDIVYLDEHDLILDNNSTSVGTARVEFVGASVFEIQPGSSYEHQGGMYFLNGNSDDLFVNDGTLIKSVDAGTSWIRMPISNSGLIRVQTGTLAFYHGGSSSGDFLAEPGTTFEFTGGQEFLPSSSIVAENVLFTYGIGAWNYVRGTYNVSTATTVKDYQTVVFTDEATILNYGSSFYIPKGAVDFNGNVVGGMIQFDTLQVGPGGGDKTGTANFMSGDPVQVTTLNLGPGTVKGPSTITIDGLLTWNTAGGFSGPGTVNANGGVLVNPGGGEKWIRDCIFNNAATATLLGGFNMPYGAVAFNNLATGVIDIQADSGSSGSIISGLGKNLNNAGTLIKSAGAGISTISVSTTNTGTVEVQTGVLRFYTYYGMFYTQTAGETILNGGDIFMFGPAPLQINDGLLTGAGTITGNVLNIGGTTAPGLPVGQLDVDGAYTQGAGAALQVEIGGEAPGQFDKVVCTGTASLAGTLEIVLSGPFQPQVGDSFEILSASSVVGEFDTVIGTDLPGDDDLSVIYTPNAVIVGICPVVPADFDGDCNVDQDDFDVFGAAYGHSSGDPEYNPDADFDGDGDVDCRDWFVFLSHWTGPPTEPPTIVDCDRPPAIATWETAVTHGSAGKLYNVVTDQDIEPRTHGVTELRVTFDLLINPATATTSQVTVIGADSGDVSARVNSVAFDGSDTQMTITLSPALPDQDTYTLTIGAGVQSMGGEPLGGDRDIVFSTLAGDVIGNGLVDHSDMVGVRLRRAQVVTEANCTYDVNCSGVIDNSDLIAVRVRTGNQVP